MEELPQIEKVIQTTYVKQTGVYVKENTMNDQRQLGKRSITQTLTAQSATNIILDQHTPFFLYFIQGLGIKGTNGSLKNPPFTII
jgi:hypothetical protein